MTLPTIEYRLVTKCKLIRDKPKWAWRIYAGQDGSILVFKPEQRKHGDQWERLGQTWNENGYWLVSIKDVLGGYQTEQVQQLVVTAFDKEKLPDDSQKCHLDIDKDNNEESNFRWGNHRDNKKDETKTENLPRKKHWKKWKDSIDTAKVEVTTLPYLKGKKRYLTKKGKRKSKHIRYGCKWQFRGLRPDDEITDAMPEKKWRPFDGCSLSDGEGKEMQMPELEGWDTGNGKDENDFDRVSDKRLLSLILTWHPPSGWLPFKQRFSDSLYSKLVEGGVPQW